MKVGEMVELTFNFDQYERGLVIREMTFKNYCDKHDDLMLEYDVDNAWIKWEKDGPTFEVMCPDGEITVMWNREQK